MRFTLPVLLIVILALLIPTSMGLKVISGDSVSIDTPEDDDVVAWGNFVSLDAPVHSLVVFGEKVVINDPIAGDLIVLGNQVSLNSDVGGKVIAAGTNINVKGNISRNAILAASKVDIKKSSHVGIDAFIMADRIINSGTINGTLNVTTSALNNSGTVGVVDLHKVEHKREDDRTRSQFGFFQMAMIIGFLIAGMVLLRFYPDVFHALDLEIRGSPATRTVVGFICMIVTVVVMIILTITIIGIPMALMSLVFMAAALLTCNLFVSFALGKAVTTRIGKGTGDMASFFVGFVVLNLILIVPVVGWIASLVSSSIGFGAIVYALMARISS